MPMYACDVNRVFPGTKISQIVEAASLTPEEAACHAAYTMEIAPFLGDQVSLEELSLLLTEAGERSLNLSNLARGEIFTLMKTKSEISFNRRQKEWTVKLPSGSITFGEMEDFCIEIMGAKLNS